jgi:hypothetical protein
MLRLQLSHLLLPGQLDGELSPIIVLATVVTLYIPFALSSDRRYLRAMEKISPAKCAFFDGDKFCDMASWLSDASSVVCLQSAHDNNDQ